MPIKITEDNVPGARYRYGPNGSTLVRRFHVEGLDPTRNDNTAQATTVPDATTGKPVPRYMEAHPTVPNLNVSNYDCWAAGTQESPSKTAVWVDVLYQSPQFFAGQNLTMVRIAGVDTTRAFNLWPSGPAQGTPIVVIAQADPTTGTLDTTVDFTGITDAAAFLVGQPEKQGIIAELCEFQKLDGGTILEFTRVETNPPDMTLRKKTNLKKWQGLPPGCWLCRDVVADQVFAGLGSTTDGWRSVYTFESCTDEQMQIAQKLGRDDLTGQPYGGWTQIAYWREPSTGRAVPTVSLKSKKNGWQACDPYLRKDFNPLKLPTIYT